MGGLSYNEVMDKAKDQATAKLFPEAPLPDWQEPTQRELRADLYMKEYLRKLRFSAYHVAVPEEKDSSTTKFTDRYDEPVDQLPTMASDAQKERMGMEFFPTMTWQAFYNKQARVLRRRKLKKQAGQVLGADDNAEEGEEGKEGEERGSGDEEEEEVDEFDDEEENPDYDNNYFSDGGDDQDDDGGNGNEGGTYD